MDAMSSAARPSAVVEPVRAWDPDAVRRHRFTVDDFARMGEAGIFTEDDRVELLDGEIWDMTPIGPLHAWLVNRLFELLVTRLAGRAYVSAQNPVRLDRRSEPQPDLTVARLGPRYADHHPGPADALLVIEVADSSLRHDRERKLPRYAQAGVPEAWLVGAEAREVTVCGAPGPQGYRDQQVRRGSDVLTSVAVEGLRMAVDEIFD